MSPRRDPAPFQAQYGGRCAADCGDPIRPDDWVLYVADELVHEECAPLPARRSVPARPEPAVCPSCWTMHAGECL